MSDAEDNPEQLAAEAETPEKPVKPKRRRWGRHALLSLLGILILSSAAIVTFCLWLNSSSCEELIRRRLIAYLEKSTGARVELSGFHWHPFLLQTETNGLVLHGKESATEEPLLRVATLKVQLSLLDIFSPHLLLHSLEIDQPQTHLILYADGSSNIPLVKKREKKNSKSLLETLFDLKAGRADIQGGRLWLEDRASSFDFQDRYAPLNLHAEDFSLLLTYTEPHSGQPESFHVETGAKNLVLTRGPAAKPGLEHGDLPVEGRLQASLDITHTALYLRSLQITAHARKVPDRILTISGSLQDFNHPRWQFRTTGDLDLRLVEPLTVFPSTPEGLAHLDLQTNGQGSYFRSEGTLRVENGAYIGNGVYARGFQLQTRVYADSDRLLVHNILLKLHQGGVINGNLDLVNWLKFVPPPKGVNPLDFIENPVDGRVDANFSGVHLNTIMAMFCDPPFQNLGIDTQLNGPASAHWEKGDDKTLEVGARFVLTAPQKTTSGMTPATGTMDATYYHRDGSVDVRGVDLQMPQSRVTAHGRLGAYPLTLTNTSTALNVDLLTRDLGEFDTVLRDLELPYPGPDNNGAAAIPLALHGQAEFHGTWTGSIMDPRLSGQVKAANIALLIAAPATAPTVTVSAPAAGTKNGLVDRLLSEIEKKKAVQAPPPPAPKAILFDSVEASGVYTGNQIRIDHGVLKQHQSTIEIDGTLNATTVPGKEPEYNLNSQLHAHLKASQVSTDQVRAVLDHDLPVHGILDTQLNLFGPLHTLSGSGSMDLSKASIYGEPITKIHAQGSFAGQSVKLSSLTVAGTAGQLSASGSVDLTQKQFQLEASTSSIDLAKLESLKRQGITADGKLAFTISGSGSFDDPHLKAYAILANLGMDGDTMGTVQLTAHTSDKMLHYDLVSKMNSPQLNAHGDIALQGDHQSQLQLNFSHLNVGTLLHMTQMKGLNISSEMAGAIHLEGPLSHPEAMRGDARLQEMSATFSGVQLHSDGEVHASLSNGRLHLDPTHITGDNTNMQLQGSLSLLSREQQQLDFSTSGTINLALASTIDPDLTASGTSTFSIEAHGPLQKPDLRGRVDFQNGALALEDLPNGLSQIHGSLEFNQNRLEVKSLQAQTGGGQLTVGGYLAYQKGLYANLTANGKGIRIRYPQGVSSLADASLRLQGTQNNLLLSGNVLITRFTISPDFDFSSLASQTSGVQSWAAPDAPSNHVRLDIHLTSSPQLNFQNAIAKLAGDVDLHLRGTLASPSLLGRVSITEGSAMLAGTRYELQQGQLTFNNPVRILPTIDLNATAHVEDFDIALGVHGPIDRPTISYRSDPPLPEADVVALLALGRTQSQQRLYTAQQQSQSSPTDALLGGALNATVSSRVQKLFGTGSVKVDPNYLGALGNSTSRIIVEEQVGRNLTLTWATNVNTTGQQLLQADIAINHHVSLQLARDESGVFSMVLKLTRRYK